MGFWGTLLGWDQSMAAVNALLASHLIEKADSATRVKIAQEVAKIISSVQRNNATEAILRDVSSESRAVQMNFIALACDNLGITPPVRNNVWTRVKNPYLAGGQVDANRMAVAANAIKKQDGVSIIWPGDGVRIDFTKMYASGLLN